MSTEPTPLYDEVEMAEDIDKLKARVRELEAALMEIAVMQNQAKCGLSRIDAVFNRLDAKGDGDE
jgi:hypothetical protein